MPNSTLQPSAFKVCPKCGQSKPADQFAKDKRRNDGLQFYCRACHAVMRQERYWGDESHREKQRAQWREYGKRPKVQERKKKREKTIGYQINTIRARVAVGTAVRRGHLSPASTMVCVVCKKAQAEQWHHHNGYDKAHWLDVVPVCRECHGKEHWRNNND